MCVPKKINFHGKFKNRLSPTPPPHPTSPHSPQFPFYRCIGFFNGVTCAEARKRDSFLIGFPALAQYYSLLSETCACSSFYTLSVIICFNGCIGLYGNDTRCEGWKRVLLEYCCLMRHVPAAVYIWLLDVHCIYSVQTILIYCFIWEFSFETEEKGVFEHIAVWNLWARQFLPDCWMNIVQWPERPILIVSLLDFGGSDKRWLLSQEKRDL